MKQWLRIRRDSRARQFSVLCHQHLPPHLFAGVASVRERALSGMGTRVKSCLRCSVGKTTVVGNRPNFVFATVKEVSDIIVVFQPCLTNPPPNLYP